MAYDNCYPVTCNVKSVAGARTLPCQARPFDPPIPPGNVNVQDRQSWLGLREKISRPVGRCRPGNGCVADRTAPSGPGSHASATLQAHSRIGMDSTAASSRGASTFCEGYNQVQPHEAPPPRTPATLFASSPREYPERVLDPEHPLYREQRRVRRDGALKFHGQHPISASCWPGNRSAGWRSRRNGGRSGSATTRWTFSTPPRGSSGASAPQAALQRPSKPPWRPLMCKPSGAIKV